MCAVNVCRLCLAVDASMRVIAGSPLQDIYEKLTVNTLNKPHRTEAACYVCYEQLRKCHNLMVRTVRADKVLTQILQRGDVVDEEFVAMLNKYHLGYGLSVTPAELIDIIGTEDSYVNVDIIEDPLLSRCSGEMETDKQIYVENLKFKEHECEEIVQRDIPDDVDDIETKELINRDDVKQELLKAVGIEDNELTDEDEVNLEEFEEEQCVEELKHEDTKQEFGAPVMECNESQGLAPSIQKQEENVLEGVDKHGIVLEDISSVNAGSIGFDNSSNKHLTEIFICNDCGNVFDDKYLLTEHIERHNVMKMRSNLTGGEENSRHRPLRKQRCSRTGDGNKQTETHSGRFECDICHKKYTTKQSVNRHLRTHTEEKPFQCDICQVKFKVHSNLKKHLRIHAGERPFKCEICQNKFKQNSYLIKHLRIHTGEKPFKCEICHARLTRNSYLKKHLRIHTVNFFQCDICEVKFNLKKNLKKHLRTHTGEKPKNFKCEICHRLFTQKYNLKAHMRTHTGEKPFKCEICHAKLSTNYWLKLHVRAHTGETPFKCEICHVKFTTNLRLKAHLRTHTVEKIFECETCQVKYNLKRDLKRHLRTHADKKPFKCEICHVIFKLKSSLRDHLNIHTGEKPFKCDICQKKFACNQNLYRHKKIHTGEKPFECHICQAKFNCRQYLHRHYIVHTGEKPFECDICQARFTQKANLQRHIKTHRSPR